MTWTAAFAGIPFYKRSGAELHSDETLAEVLERRIRNRLDSEGVTVPIASLIDVAQRIQDQSERIVALEGAGLALGPADLSAYEAAQAAEAERAAAKSGVLFRDLDGDWAALYDAAGRVVGQGHVSSLQEEVVLRDGWIVTIHDAEVLGAAGLDCWPDTAGEAAAVARRYEDA